MTGRRADTYGAAIKHGDAIHLTIGTDDEGLFATCSACDWKARPSMFGFGRVALVGGWALHIREAHPGFT